MAKRSVGITALGPAVGRLIEQAQPGETRLFSDPVTEDLVAWPIRALMWLPGVRRLAMKGANREKRGVYGGFVCRTRYIDDAVQAALSRGIGQLVILGAGLDTRPYRLAGVERMKAFEVDMPSVQDGKKKKLLKRFGRLPENVTFIPIDFNTQSLEAAFAGTAFDPSRPVVFIWEGVTQYLTEQAVGRTMAFVGKSAPGSILVFTYILKSVIERRSTITDAEKAMDIPKRLNALWLFGLDPPEIPSYLTSFHLSLLEDVGNADYQQRYLKPLGRNLAVFEIERIVQATVTGS